MGGDAVLETVELADALRPGHANHVVARSSACWVMYRPSLREMPTMDTLIAAPSLGVAPRPAARRTVGRGEALPAHGRQRAGRSRVSVPAGQNAKASRPPTRLSRRIRRPRDAG